MSRIRVTIDRLSLKGFEASDHNGIVEGLRGELSQVLSDPAARADWARTRSMPVLKLGHMPLEPGASGGRKFGKQLARVVGRGLKT
jgi:hypothetical protein